MSGLSQPLPRGFPFTSSGLGLCGVKERSPQLGGRQNAAFPGGLPGTGLVGTGWGSQAQSWGLGGGAGLQSLAPRQIWQECKPPASRPAPTFSGERAEAQGGEALPGSQGQPQCPSVQMAAARGPQGVQAGREDQLGAQGRWAWCERDWPFQAQPPCAPCLPPPRPDPTALPSPLPPAQFLARPPLASCPHPQQPPELAALRACPSGSLHAQTPSGLPSWSKDTT